MMDVFTIFRNNFYRMMTKKMFVIISLVVTPLMIVASIYFTKNVKIKPTIAVISDNSECNMKNDDMEVKVVDEEPEIWQLLTGTYDAVVIDNGNNDYTVKTIRSDKLKEEVENYFSTGSLNVEESTYEKRGVGTNILGFLVMILLLQGVNLMTLYPEDRDLGTFRRILTSPVGVKKYLFSQGLFDFVILFVPTYISILIANVFFGVDIGYSQIDFIALISLFCIFTIAFSLFITTVFDDIDVSTTLAGCLAIVGSLLSGAFIPFEETGELFNKATDLSPIKSFLTIAECVGNGNSIVAYFGELIYIIIWTIVLWEIGSIITKKQLKIAKY